MLLIHRYTSSNLFSSQRIEPRLARIIHESLCYDRHLHVISGRTRASRLDIPAGIGPLSGPFKLAGHTSRGRTDLEFRRHLFHEQTNTLFCDVERRRADPELQNQAANADPIQNGQSLGHGRG
jgi:hypothetical protein